MEQEIFTVDALPGLKFRPNFKSPIELLSFKLVVRFDNLDDMTAALNWLLERTEVQIKEDKWLPCKEPGMDVYYPADLDQNLTAMLEIEMKMLAYMKSVFKKSSESSQKQQ